MGICGGWNAYLLLPDYEEIERVTITAKVIADSIADGCPRLTTLQLRYPRFIHSEVMAHRAFSRNASSSRAIPIERLIQDVIDDPAMPIHWGANKPGMQAGEELESGETEWILASESAIHHARRMARMGYHKQIVNRLLEPFAHINVLITATEGAYEHFFSLRDHPDAQPEIAALARAMRGAMCGSTPDYMSEGEWHLPYCYAEDAIDCEGDLITLRKISAARCASVSYKTVDGKPMTIDKALKIYDKLAGSDPIHASPFEHIARPCPECGPGCRNFDRWWQWRADLEN
jgi:thymidylate synthase ThyX